MPAKEVRCAPGETLRLSRVPSLVGVTKPLLTPAQETAGPEDTAVALLLPFRVEELLRAALFGQRGLFPLYLHLVRSLGLGDGRLFELLSLVLGRGRLYLGLFCWGLTRLGFFGEWFHVFGAQHFRRLLFLDFGLFERDVGGRELFLAYGLFRDGGFRLHDPGGVRVYSFGLRGDDDLLFGLEDHILGDGQTGVRAFAVRHVFSHRTDAGVLRWPGLLLGGLADHGDGLGVEPLAQRGLYLPGQGDLHVVHHFHVGLEEVAEVVCEALFRLLQRLVGILDALDARRGVGEHLVGARLRLPYGEVRLPLGALAQVLGLARRGAPEVVGGVLGVDEGGADGALKVLELLQPVAQARDLLAHPLVLRVVALELVGNRVEEVVHLVGVVAAEAALELLTPDVDRSYGHLGSPRSNWSYKVVDDDRKQGPGYREAEDRDDRREVYPETAELQHRNAAPYGPEDRVGHRLDRIVDGLHEPTRGIARKPGEKDGRDDECEQYVVGVVDHPLQKVGHVEPELLQGDRHPPSPLALSVAASTPS